MSASRRATLLHNPSAGDARPTEDDLKQILADAGFQVRYLTTDEGWKKALADPADLVVVAGGDGTVAKVTRAMLDHPVPLGVLPAGTANNIARTLGVAGDAREIVARWRDASPRDFDIGLVTSGPSTESRFVESAGGGVFAAAILRGNEDVEESSWLVGGEIDRAVLLIRELLADATAEHWDVTLDGRDFSGRYVAIEAMNIRFIGPSVPLAPDADPGDGLLDVVLVSENQREPLLDYLARRIADASAMAPELPVQRVRTLSLKPPSNTVMHVDDEPFDATGSPIEVALRPGALKVMPGNLDGRG